MRNSAGPAADELPKNLAAWVTEGDECDANLFCTDLAQTLAVVHDAGRSFRLGSDGRMSSDL